MIKITAVELVRERVTPGHAIVRPPLALLAPDGRLTVRGQDAHRGSTCLHTRNFM